MRNTSSLLAAALLCGASTTGIAATASFGGQEFELVGSASVIDNTLQLTPAQSDNAGAAWLTSRIPTGTSFSVSFSFSLAEGGALLDQGSMADGIAFAIQPESPFLLGGGGGGIGYEFLGAVGSIIQTWDNNRVGLNTDGDPFNANAAPAILGRASLVTGTQYVAYDAGTHVLSMSGTLNVDGTIYDISDSTTIDLGTHYSSAPVYIGFTGGTGMSYADQRITAFALNPVPEPGVWLLMLAGLGCVASVARTRRARC